MGGRGGAGGGDGIGDDDEGVFLVGVAEEHHGEVVRGAQGVDEGGEGGGGPSLDGDVGKTGGKDGGPALVGEIVLGEDVGGGDEGRGRGGDGGGGDGDVGAAGDVVYEGAVIGPVACGGVGEEDVVEDGGGVDFELEAEGGGEKGIDGGGAEDDAAGAGETAGDGGFEPGAIERAGDDEIGVAGREIGDEGGEGGTRFLGLLTEGI